MFLMRWSKASSVEPIPRFSRWRTINPGSGPCRSSALPALFRADANDPDSDLEVIDALQPTSRSFSAMPPPSHATNVHDDVSDVEELGAAPGTTSPSSVSSAYLRTSMPLSLPEDPLQDFLNSYGISGISTDIGATANIGAFTSAGPSIDPFPLLLLPPPESPPAPSPAVKQSPEPGPSALKSCRPRQEVDEANTVTSTRTRAPTERKRFADQDISNRPRKRGRMGKVGLLLIVFSVT
ncbi:hypothetical protein B0H13DRAFT_1851098 [Mycena leptocephala]|nr:hypothetical protein B0H13DRAFT_1851098 [Mycena leptocephala]